MPRLAALVCLLSGAEALRLEPPTGARAVTRRGAVQSLAALAAVAVAHPALAITSKQALREEIYDGLLERKEAERIAALPISKLKARRTSISEGASLIESGSWDALRDEIGVQSVVNAINLAAGDGNAGKEKLAGVRDLKLKLVKQLTSVEKFAYEQQKAEFLPAGFSGAGYCAPGVVPREDSACKVRPVGEKDKKLVELKEAVATLDEIIKALS